jgi:hypothetical protein
MQAIVFMSLPRLPNILRSVTSLDNGLIETRIRTHFVQTRPEPGLNKLPPMTTPLRKSCPVAGIALP